jgi:CubicO group peptidase (beta-lactamase class C family)
MQERVFQPLGMTRTSMVTEKRFEDDYANAYDEWGISLGIRIANVRTRPALCRLKTRPFA